ncbi:MAG: DegT/DnrJ/EryC1/StrS family aminotransferase [Deltaproteobacteria bacterium]|nr:DegT/DnrJ/EryC1/StrS family aminotransferase [Deltaproteobacteria bacterium]
MGKKTVPFTLPLIEEEEKREVLEVLESGWLTTGPKTKQFEKEFSSFVGAKHAIAVNSCTAALHLALETIGIQEGDEVIIPPMTFAATAEVVRYFNARPVFVDIDPYTLNIAPDKIESEKGKSWKEGKAKAVIPVHFAGLPCDMDAIIEIANRHSLKVIEDAAHTLPSRYKGKMVGTIGDITCFSFYATKTITTGEGGMITTENDEYAERMRIMSLHGISRDAWNRYSSEGSWYYEIMAPGFKYNLTDLAAAVGLAQLKKAESMYLRRRKIASLYNEAFKDISSIDTPFYEESRKMENITSHSWHLYVIKLNLETLTIDRDEFIDELKNKGIGTSVHFIPLHMHPYYRDTYGHKPEDFPVAYETYKRIISLPIYPKMTDDDVGRVVEAVKELVKKYRK